MINELLTKNFEQKPRNSVEKNAADNTSIGKKFDKTALMNEIVAPTNFIGYQLASEEVKLVLGDDYEKLKTTFDVFHKTLANIIDTNKK